MIRYLEADVMELDLMKQYLLVYADPPYAGCRFKYARKVKSRQWGRSARADFLRELIAVMERHRRPDGVCAMSMGSPELELLSLFPSKRRVFAWVKPYAPHRPHVWPTYAWEPVVAWGRLPNREEQRLAKTPHDWLQLSPKVPKKDGHETPKPEAFGEWIFNLTLGPRRGPILELFSGTAPVARAAIAHDCAATAVDVDERWTSGSRSR